MLCDMCKHDPCKAILYKDFIEGELSTLSGSLDNSKKRNHLYRCFVFSEYGTLGCHNRIHIPDCVLAFICSVCPDPQNRYTAHREFNEECNKLDNIDDVDRPNESFKSILPDAVQGSIDFDGGEKFKVSVSFENDVFDIAKVRQFVAESPVEGWQVYFPVICLLMQQLFAP